MSNPNRSASATLISALFAIVFVGTGRPISAQELYRPIPISSSSEITDALSEKDIPTGQGGFARDYKIRLEAGDQVAIDLASDSFDTIITLLAEDGSTVAENDDGPDGTTNSLLFTRITKTGDYILRVRSFGEATGGSFTLEITKLRPIKGI